MSTAPIFLTAAASTRAAPCVSIVCSAASVIRMASSAPMARACLSASLPDSGPMHKAVTVPPTASFWSSAPSTAYSSNGLMTTGASPHEICPPAAVTLASESGTCFTQATIFTDVLRKMRSLAHTADRGQRSAVELAWTCDCRQNRRLDVSWDAGLLHSRVLGARHVLVSRRRHYKRTPSVRDLTDDTDGCGFRPEIRRA